MATLQISLITRVFDLHITKEIEEVGKKLSFFDYHIVKLARQFATTQRACLLKTPDFVTRSYFLPTYRKGIVIIRFER